MPTSVFSKVFAPLAFLFLIGSAFSVFLAQNTQPSPTPSSSPSPSPSASPVRAPSPTPLPGAQNFHQWGAVTVFNGLPSDSVRAIAQTHDGVMWFGTDNGLARFDGRRMQNFSPGGNEASNGILALEYDEKADALWVGTRSGAFLYVGNRFEAIDGTQDVGITAILIAGEIYLGTDTGMVFRYSGAATPAFSEPLRSPDGGALAITGIVETGGRLIVSTAGRGVFVIRDNAAVELPIAPSPPGVNSLARSETGELWLGADATKGVSGVYSADPNPVKTRRHVAPTSKVLTLEINDGGVWAGTERYGLFRFVRGVLEKSYTFANTSGGLRSDTIFALFTDREGVLWIGTNRGASRFDRMGSVQQTVSDLPNSNFIRTLWQPKHHLYAGSNRGLFEYDGKDNWRKVPGFEERVIYSLKGDYDGPNLLVGTSTGVLDSRGRLLVSGDTRSIAIYDKTYAAVMGRGVVDISSGRQDVIFPDDTACSLLAGHDRLWIGTAGHGLFSFDGKSAKAEVSPDILKSGAIWNMDQDVDRSIWIAGQHGVFRVKDGEVEPVIKVEDVRDVFVSGRDVWAATTTRGLLHARRDERFGWLVTSIGFEQGLPSEKAFSIVPGDGLLIATNRGVVTYRPGTIGPKLIAVRILSQRVHDLAELRSKIDLEYPQNSLLVEVAGQSSRTFPEEFQYAFVLKNSKGEEIARQLSNEPQYAPADLKPGDYTIESFAFNRDLLASEPLMISFSVAKAPFPWTATALGVLLLMSLVALVWAIVEHRRITQRNRELAVARLDLANEAERERRRIARDLHDQTLADLRNLMMTTDKFPTAGGELREEIESISTDIRRICEDLSPSVLENVGLVAALEFLLSRSGEKGKFSADENVEERIEFPLNVQLQIYRIAQEVLTNIKRHSDATEVEMNVGSDGSDFVLTIRDNGRVFQPDGAQQKGRGISNIRSRANLINGKVAWKESRRGGNIFRLSIAVPS